MATINGGRKGRSAMAGVAGLLVIAVAACSDEATVTTVGGGETAPVTEPPEPTTDAPTQSPSEPTTDAPTESPTQGTTAETVGVDTDIDTDEAFRWTDPQLPGSTSGMLDIEGLDTYYLASDCVLSLGVQRHDAYGADDAELTDEYKAHVSDLMSDSGTSVDDLDSATVLGPDGSEIEFLGMATDRPDNPLGPAVEATLIRAHSGADTAMRVFLTCDVATGEDPRELILDLAADLELEVDPDGGPSASGTGPATLPDQDLPELTDSAIEMSEQLDGASAHEWVVPDELGEPFDEWDGMSAYALTQSCELGLGILDRSEGSDADLTDAIIDEALLLWDEESRGSYDTEDQPAIPVLLEDGEGTEELEFHGIRGTGPLFSTEEDDHVVYVRGHSEAGVAYLIDVVCYGDTDEDLDAETILATMLPLVGLRPVA